MPRFKAPTTREAIALAVRGINMKKSEVQGSHLKDQGSTSTERLGFGTFPIGSRIPGTGRRGFRNFESAENELGQQFERLARQYYPTEARQYDNGRLRRDNMIPELAADIYIYLEGWVPYYAFSNFVSGWPVVGGAVTPNSHTVM